MWTLQRRIEVSSLVPFAGPNRTINPNPPTSARSRPSASPRGSPRSNVASPPSWATSCHRETPTRTRTRTKTAIPNRKMSASRPSSENPTKPGPRYLPSARLGRRGAPRRGGPARFRVGGCGICWSKNTRAASAHSVSSTKIRAPTSAALGDAASLCGGA